MINTRKENPYWTPSRKGFITNYPNFQHWKKMDASAVSGGQSTPLNIYLHTPFCAQRCSYCYYRVISDGRRDEMQNYVDALCKEIEVAADHFDLASRPVRSIYFGGGTPTLLTPANLEQVTAAVHKHLNVSSDVEYTVEGEPVTMTEKKAKALQELGVNRISMGVQSLSDEIIKLSNRQDTQAKVLRAIEFARNTGAVVNIDLMSGLAGETADSWKYSVDKALETGVESITVYKMEVYTNTQYYKDLRTNSIVLPTDEEELKFMQYALDKFEETNYKPWSFFTFTKDGGSHNHVHAPSIWSGEDVYCFGASAFGRMGNHLFQNTNDVDKYIETVNSGNVPINRGHYMTSLDKMIRDIVMGLKLVKLDLKVFRERHGFALDKICAATLENLKSEGFLTIEDEVMTLTQKGMLHGDYVGKSLGGYLADFY